MLLYVYIATVLASSSIDVVQYIQFQIELKKYGYEYNKPFVVGKAIDHLIYFVVYSFTYPIIFIIFLLRSSIPILNVVSAVKNLNNWKENINTEILRMEEFGLIYNKYSYDFNSILKSGEKFKVAKLALDGSDIVRQEMVESMYLDGASVSQIKDELRDSKAERLEIISGEKTKKALDFGNSMIDETMFSLDLTGVDKKKLLKLYKKVLLHEKKTIMTPIEKTYDIMENNYQKVKK